MAESNYFTHHILNCQAQTHTQKRGLGSEASSSSSYTNQILIINHKHTHKKEPSDPRPLLRAPTYELSKRRNGRKQQIYTSHFKFSSTNTHTKKRPRIRGLFFELLHMDLAKEEMAESNNFRHHILIVEAQTHTQKRPRIRGLFFELLHIDLAKEEMAKATTLHITF